MVNGIFVVAAEISLELRAAAFEVSDALVLSTASPQLRLEPVLYPDFDGLRCEFKIADITAFMVEFPSIGQKNAPDTVEFVANA